jgi:geranylgeranyl reductase family protein
VNSIREEVASLSLHYDVIISGAGPSGAYSAIQCAKKGLRTLLLEKEKMPRDKCCGGGILERALKYLDVRIPDSIIEKEIYGVRLFGDSSHNEIRSKSRIALTVVRRRFDAFLAETAEKEGADFIEEEVTDVTEYPDHIEVSTNNSMYEGKCLILAEGAHSRSANKLLGPYKRNIFASGMSKYIWLSADPGNMMEFYFFTLERERSFLEFKPPAYGYGWLFPCSGSANIGAGGVGLNKKVIQNIIKKIETKCANEDCSVTNSDTFLAGSIPLSVRKKIHTKRAIAVGDAAGLTNPITGEGMTYSFISALRGGEAVWNFITHEEDWRHLRDYAKAIENDILRDIKAASIIEPLLRRVLGTLALDSFLDNFCNIEILSADCAKIARGAGTWKELLLHIIPMIPSLYFSSIQRDLRINFTSNANEQIEIP